VPNHKWLPACAGMTGFFVMYRDILVKRVVIKPMVVDFPAPLAPNNAKKSPQLTVKSMSFTA